MKLIYVGFLLISLFSGVFAAVPIGRIDQVVNESGQWNIRGWACQPNLGQAIQVRLYLNNQPIGTTSYTNQIAEQGIHTVCSANPSPLLLYRFSIPYNPGPLSGQNVRVDAIGPGGTSVLSGSNQFGLPNSNQTPDAVFSASTRILLLIAHQDDEIVFSPFLKKYCNGYRTCRLVTATNDPVRASEWPVSVNRFLALSDLGGFSWHSENAHPSAVLQDWNIEAAGLGLVNLNNVIANEIDKFSPNLILTFDPRHGTSCHSEHRAVGEAVRLGVNAYSGTKFPDKSKLYFLTTRRIDSQNDTGANYIGLAPIAPTDRTSVTYSAYDYVAFAMTGWQFLKLEMETYPSQFSQSQANSTLNTPPLERTTAFQRITDYSANDVRYTNASTYDPRFFNCPSF